MAQLPPLSNEQVRTLRSWMAYTIKDLRREIDKKHIGGTGNLKSSFQGTILNGSDGNSRVAISFLYYGKFVELGVGRGVKLGDVGENKIQARLMQQRMARKPKIWFSRTMTFNVNRAAEIMQKLYGIYGIGMIENEIDNIGKVEVKI